MSDYPPMPECDRMLKVAPDSQKIGEFLEWLREQGVWLCTLNERREEFMPDGVTIERRLAQYFDIDLNKVEQERRALLEHIRSQS